MRKDGTSTERKGYTGAVLRCYSRSIERCIGPWGNVHKYISSRLEAAVGAVVRAELVQIKVKYRYFSRSETHKISRSLDSCFGLFLADFGVQRLKRVECFSAEFVSPAPRGQRSAVWGGLFRFGAERSDLA